MLGSAKILRSAVNHLKLKPITFNAPKVIVRSGSGSVTTWNKDWKPGPYPRTKEERLAAAKKYNMLPEDYEPYPEVEGYGDYPMFKPHHMESLDPFKVYEYPELKRNYGEPVHPDIDICLEDKTNFQAKFRTPMWKQILFVTGAATLWSLMILQGEYYPFERKMIPKQYPLSGQVHYTFESAE